MYNIIKRGLGGIVLEEFQICNSVSTIRKKRGYTQMELAEITKFSQQYISNVENGKIIPSISKAIVLAQALGVCYGELFFKCRTIE